MKHKLRPETCLPRDHQDAVLVGRIWIPDVGPTLVRIQGQQVHDLSIIAATSSQLLELEDPAAAVRSAHALPCVASVEEVLANSPAEGRDGTRPWFLAPCDLQAIKASGVTFVASLLERVIEEQARGDAASAVGLRASMAAVIGDNLHEVRPGSADAVRLKEVLIARGAWSQYLEVGIGPDAEIFTKASPMSAVGLGADVGVHPTSAWNNPEPEIVLAVSSRGRVVGAALGNDVNLRDFEGRSALLLGKAKDNNASCAIGPFIRLFDASYTIDTVRQCDVALRIEGSDGFELTAQSSMSRISRDPLTLVEQTLGPNHQYPDGLMLFLGTMFAPTADRSGAGQGFTHLTGDIVTIETPGLGALVNRVDYTNQIAPWTFGAVALMKNLATRGLL
ncbi:MAG: fumarylacetoacetate hydrolase family protein [Acidobacteriota bacterium]|nr:fumarylacetoacetate hydrolase family protein [Acidobacteriota bacterium]